MNTNQINRSLDGDQHLGIKLFTPFISPRHEPASRRHTTRAPSLLEESPLLARSPGIQGSRLFSERTLVHRRTQFWETLIFATLAFCGLAGILTSLLF